MIPRAYTGAPSAIKKEGSKTVTTSWPRSEKKLAIPAPKTVLFSQPSFFTAFLSITMVSASNV
jgi:hypothetical protein